VPDAKTVWLYRDALAQAAKVEELFGLFDHCPTGDACIHCPAGDCTAILPSIRLGQVAFSAHFR